MNFETVSDVFDENERLGKKFEASVSPLSEKQASRLPDGEEWSVAQIVEHVALVDEGIARICAKLAAAAEADGKQAGGLNISPDFLSKSAGLGETKIKAPERVRPVGAGTIAESLAKINASRMRLRELRPVFEKFDCGSHKFPHPFFGDLSAVEWLILVGGHKVRHLRQIKKLLEKT